MAMQPAIKPQKAQAARSSTVHGFVRLLGVRIDRVRLPQLLSAVRDAVRDDARVSIAYVNVHCMNVRAKDVQYARVLEESDIVYCDGTGVRLGAWLAGLSIPQRMTGADWIHDVCRMAVRNGMTLFLLGGEPGVTERAATALRVRHPGVVIVGTASGFESGEECIRRINGCRPDILFVGMGTPRQETWMAQHRDALDVPVVWVVGALFDFVSGKLLRGPHIMTEHGFEWLCRLAVEPRKLWRRYLIGNPLFLLRVVRASGWRWKRSTKRDGVCGDASI